MKILTLKEPLPQVYADSQVEGEFLRKLLSTNPKTRLEAQEAVGSSVFRPETVLPRGRTTLRKVRLHDRNEEMVTLVSRYDAC